jgi:hypothetical protein
VLLPAGRAHVLAQTPDGANAVPFETAVADPDGGTELLCGKYRLDRRRTHPLLAALPDVVHLPARAGDHRQLRGAVDLLAVETTGAGPGRDAAIAGLLDLLLVYMIRAWLEEHRDSACATARSPPRSRRCTPLRTGPGGWRSWPPRSGCPGRRSRAGSPRWWGSPPWRTWRSGG